MHTLHRFPLLALLLVPPYGHCVTVRSDGNIITGDKYDLGRATIAYSLDSVFKTPYVCGPGYECTYCFVVAEKKSDFEYRYLPSLQNDYYLTIKKPDLTPQEIVTAWTEKGNPQQNSSTYRVNQINEGRQLYWGFYYTNVPGEPREGARLRPVDPNTIVRVDTDRVTDCLFQPYTGSIIDFGTMSPAETRTKTIDIVDNARTCKNLQITLSNKAQKIHHNGEPRLTFSLGGVDLEPEKRHTVYKPGKTVKMTIRISADETMVGGEYIYSEIINIEPV